jgi:hypothetical protein
MRGNGRGWVGESRTWGDGEGRVGKRGDGRTASDARRPPPGCLIAYAHVLGGPLSPLNVFRLLMAMHQSTPCAPPPRHQALGLRRTLAAELGEVRARAATCREAAGTAGLAVAQRAGKAKEVGAGRGGVAVGGKGGGGRFGTPTPHPPRCMPHRPSSLRASWRASPIPHHGEDHPPPPFRTPPRPSSRRRGCTRATWGSWRIRRCGCRGPTTLR